jgi:hypothetical protein
MTATPGIILPGNVEFHDTNRHLTLEDDRAIIRRQQEIPENFWQRLRELKHVQDTKPVGEFLQVASIPTTIVEEWFAEGFNIFDKNTTVQMILSRLHAEDKERLITTSRQI